MNRYFLVFLLLLTGLVNAQPIASAVYSWTKAPVVTHQGYEERVLIQGTTRDFSHLSVRGVTLTANQALSAQKVDEEQLLIIKEGKLTVTLLNKTRQLGPGSTVLVMPGDVHRIENQSANPVTYYLMRYTSNEMPDLDLDSMAGESFWVDWQTVAFQPHSKGGLRRMFDRGTVMTRRFEMHVTTLNAGLWSHPPHTHRAAEILIMVDGTAQESIDGTFGSAGAGDLIFLESNVPHAIQNTGQQACTYFAFQF